MLRIPSLKFGRVYRCGKFLFIVALFVILLMNTHNLFASFQRNELTDRRFIGLNKCPACFGTSWCRKFMNGQVTFEMWGRLRFLDFFNVKNVYFAQYGEPREGTRRVVLKRLGSNQELAEIDQKICKRATGRPRCDLIQGMYKTEFAQLNGDVRLLTPEVVEGWSDLVHCPSQRLLDRVVRRYAETKDSGSFLLKNLKDTERMQLLMTLAFNPEPLVLQSFPSDEGWPFAKYLGACGRMVAVNYVGEELWNFYNAPWEKRVDLAKQLMDIAEQLTNNDFDFALYLLDVSFDNFAVGPRDGKVIVVDAENIIVADKRLIKQSKPENYDVWYESRYEECDKEACLSFSKDILCSRVTVDHNYYAICQNLLSRFATWRGTTGGLLHDPPADLVKDGHLTALLDECTRPQKQYGRFQAAKELREYLTELTQLSNVNR
uniref:Divergent protein kinase domain 2Aa n=1 Tax=Cyprinus carpio TaxID=7962 RepID=A0A8C1SVY0_CYPCA